MIISIPVFSVAVIGIMVYDKTVVERSALTIWNKIYIW